MKRLILILTIAFSITTLNAQTGNVGVGTTSPSTKLDVNGAATYREGSPVTVSGASVIIPDLSFSQYRLTGAPTAAFSVTGPTTSNGSMALLAGARLILVNSTTQPGVLNGFTIIPGSAQEFTFSNGNWIAIRNPGAPIGLFAKSAGTQVISSAAVINDWTVTVNNFGSAWNGSVFTVPAGMQGWYSLSAGYRTNPSYGGGLGIRTPAQHVIITVNGVAVLQGSPAVLITSGTVNGNAPGAGSANTSGNYYLNAGDQVAVTASQLSYRMSDNGVSAANSFPDNTYISILKM